MKLLTSFILFVLFTGTTRAQIDKFFPSKLRIGTDLSYLGMSLVNPERKQAELNADLDVSKFFIVADYGWGSWKFKGSNFGNQFSIENSGTYFRAGVDYNAVKKIPNDQIIFLGLRYASSHFSESFAYMVTDTTYGVLSGNYDAINRTANWFEFVAGMKVRVWHELFLGWTGRFKFARTISSDPTTFNNFWIPGYGKSKNDSTWGLNYHIFYRIPFRKKKEVQKAKLPAE